MCRKFGLVNSTKQMIWKKKPKLIMRLNRRNREIIQFQKPEGSDVAEALLKYFRK